MEGTLDSLEAKAGELFSRVPILFRLLMRLIAMLRDGIGRLPQDELLPEACAEVPVASGIVVAEAPKGDGRGTRAPRVRRAVAAVRADRKSVV